MAGSKTFELRVVFNRLPQMAAEIASQGAAHVEQTADRVASEAAARAPVDTGYLQGSIHRTGSGLQSGVVAEAEYAVYQEYGTHKMAAHPFFWPAVEQERSGYVQGWRSLLAGTGARSGSLTTLPGRGTIRRVTGGRLPR